MAGILNMLYTKTAFHKNHSAPIDGGRVLRDGRRIFGDNKTWSGFCGMIVCGVFSQVVWGLLCRVFSGLGERNYIYMYNDNCVSLNIFIGILIGSAYALFELPNSFAKRRLDIPSGKTVGGVKGRAFFVIDQIDSLVGVILVTALFYPMPVWQYFLYLLLGAVTHIGVNAVLYGVGIRRDL